VPGDPDVRDPWNGSSITGNGCINVIDVTNISLSAGTLTLNGGPTDSFIINVSGTMTLSGGSAIVLSGMSPSQVLFNIEGTGTDVNFNGTRT